MVYCGQETVCNDIENLFFYRVLVGAPLSNVSTLSGDFVRYGDVYKCEYTGVLKACVALNVDNRGRNFCNFFPFAIPD